MRENLCAIVTACAAQTGIEQNIRAGRATFRVLAPGTSQRTTFEKHHSADAGAVMRGITLHIENHLDTPLCLFFFRNLYAFIRK
jgi:hypothetical protein